MLDYSVAQQSHQGGRDYNEDRTAVFERDDAVLLVVADGLGGHAGGAIASQAFIDAMGASFGKATDEQLNDAENFLLLSINYAHHMIHRRAVAQGFAADSPKTTCVVCLIKDDLAHWAHSGDSRLYLIRKREIFKRTADHVSDKVSSSGNSPISRCVGGHEPPKPELSDAHDMQQGDILVLASDGAWASFKPEDLRDYVDAEHPTLGLDSLLQELENRNKSPSDNLSMVILFWGIEQLDKPSITESPVEKIQLLQAQEIRPETLSDVPKFDIKDLDNTITDIEKFILELDDKL